MPEDRYRDRDSDYMSSSRDKGRSAHGRSRSPSPSRRTAKKPAVDSGKDPVAAAAAAAARINAMLQTRQASHSPSHPGPQHQRTSSGSSQTQPALHQHSETGEPTSTVKSQTEPSSEVRCIDGDWMADIEINDLRNRYTLTKGGTQTMIKEETGADVTTRGRYYPDRSLSVGKEPPLYLHITSQSKESLEKALEKINELKNVELGNLIDERRFKRRDSGSNGESQSPRPEGSGTPSQVHGSYGGHDRPLRRQWAEDRVAINIDAPPGLHLRGQIVGPGGQNVKHVQHETGCRVQIKGRGSGFIEQSTGQEADEPMFLHIRGPEPSAVERAKTLCEDLVSAIADQAEEYRRNAQQMQQRYASRGGMGDGYGNDNRGGYGRQQHYHNNGGSASHSPYNNNYSQRQQQSHDQNQWQPSNNQEPKLSSGDYAAYYAKAAAGMTNQDPYAAYGGYEAYQKYYQQYQNQQPQPYGAEVPAPSQGDTIQHPAPPGISRSGSAASPPPPGMPTSVPAPPPPPPGVSSGSPPPPPPGMPTSTPPPPPPPGVSKVSAPPPPPPGVAAMPAQPPPPPPGLS